MKVKILVSNNTTNLIEAKNILFTSDTHFYHSHIIKFCKRPFSSVEEMDEKLIENWNSVVTEDDLVFHLGDFAFGGNKEWSSIRNRLNGEIILIEGNHDRKQNGKSKETLFKIIAPQLSISINNNFLLLNHLPFLCYPGSEKGFINLFGHVHTNPFSTGSDTPRLKYLYPTQYDVGVDNNNFTPISFDEVINIINKQINNNKNE